MPPLADVPKVLKITLKGSESEDLDIVTRHFLAYSGTPPTDGQLGTMLTALATIYEVNIADLQPGSFTLTNMIAEDLTSSTAAFNDLAVSILGERSGGQIPASVSVVISGQIARRYRGGHPRAYLRAGVSSDLADEQKWNAGFITEVLTAWNTYINGYETNGWPGAGTITPVNVSYFEGFTNFTKPSGRVIALPKPRVPAPLVDLIVNYAVNPRPASQRRRNLQGV